MDDRSPVIWARLYANSQRRLTQTEIARTLMNEAHPAFCSWGTSAAVHTGDMSAARWIKRRAASTHLLPSRACLNVLSSAVKTVDKVVVDGCCDVGVIQLNPKTG